MDLDVFLDAIVSGDTTAFGRWLAGTESTKGMNDALNEIWETLGVKPPDSGASS